jgi:hypothetical protein
MKAIAFMYVYNEADILPWTVKHLLDNGVDVHLIDNWSTDESRGLAMHLAREMPARVTVSTFPYDEPVTVSWFDMLQHVEELALAAEEYGYQWVINHDADEIRTSRNPGEKLIQAIQRADDRGYTVLNHELRLWRLSSPCEYDGLIDPRLVFTQEQKNHVDHRLCHMKCWKQPHGVRVDIASSGGHRIAFPGVNVSPEKLILNHYPLRGLEQQRRKLASRKNRWAQSDRARGWHVQYDKEQT